MNFPEKPPLWVKLLLIFLYYLLSSLPYILVVAFISGVIGYLRASGF